MKYLKVIERALVKYDPKGLILTGAPIDEYKTEAHLIAQQVRALKNPHELKRLIYAIFVTQFGLPVAGHEKDYWELANELWGEIKTIEENNVDLSSYQPVVVQQWEESERGWGTRPDGVSVHLTEQNLKMYLEGYYAELAAEHREVAPHEYSRPVMRPMTVLAPIDIYASVDKSKFDCVGIRFFQHEIEIKSTRTGTRYLKRK